MFLKCLVGAIGITICLFFIIKMIDRELCKYNLELTDENQKLKEDNALIVKTMIFIYRQLNLTRIKGCPEEEKEQIVTEICQFIEEISGINAKKES